MHADIVFLQETHFCSNAIPKPSNHFYPQRFHTTSLTSKSKGVTILLSKNVPLQVTDTLTDKQGRYIFLKGTWRKKPITLANIYSPNTSQVPFFRDISQRLSTFHTGILIVGGDFNIPLDPLMDTSTGTSHLPYRALRQIRLSLQNLLLRDAWCTLYPKEKDYTFFSAPRNRYSRLDYFFLTQRDLSYLTKATIEPMTLSDHH